MPQHRTSALLMTGSLTFCVFSEIHIFTRRQLFSVRELHCYSEDQNSNPIHVPVRSTQERNRAFDQRGPRVGWFNQERSGAYRSNQEQTGAIRSIQERSGAKSSGPSKITSCRLDCRRFSVVHFSTIGNIRFRVWGRVCPNIAHRHF